MDTNDLSELLRVKRAREKRAAARASQAEAVHATAQEHQAEADRLQAQHNSERPHKEAQVYGRLLAGPLPAREVQAETALLSGLVAVSGLLAARLGSATEETEKCAARAPRAPRAQAHAMRGTEAALAMSTALSGQTAAQADRAGELEQEDLGPALLARYR